MTRKALSRMLTCLIMTISGLAGLTVTSISVAPTATAVGNFDNSIIADYAIQHYSVGAHGGECRAFVNNVVSAATGMNVGTGWPDYFSGFESAGAQRIYNVADLRKGDIVQQGRYESYANLHTFIIVGQIAGSTFDVIDSNHGSDRKVDRYNRVVTLDEDRRAYRLGTVTETSQSPDWLGNTSNGTSLSFVGHWATGGSGQELAYITKTSDGGFAVAVHKQTPTGIVWAGVYWAQAGSSGVTYANTVFIPGDANGDGLTDLYYATSTDWSVNGFSVGLMLNNGTSLVWAGTKWAPTNLKLSQTQFISGDWTGSGRDGFAYVTPTSDNGFAVATMAPTSGAATLAWQGVKWSQQGTSGVQYSNTKFMASDMDGNGISDLYYITSTNWNQLGFAMGLQYNNGSTFTWAGNQWAPTNLKLSQTRFLPGYWTGTNRQGFAYVTPTSDGGFSLATFDSTPSGIVWQGVKWTSWGSSGVTYANTMFIPLDMDDDGYTDIDYATSSNWGNNGFAVGLNKNASGSFTWAGTQWAPTNLKLSQTSFIPQG